MQIGSALLVFLWLGSLAAQDSPTPTATATPSPAARNVRISFVPPPLDGTISLGIYDAKGKLVRVLFREADINEFTIGHDALSTTWDGKDDAGENVPAGKYSAHGFVVGDLKIEGIGFFFNDWITSAESPRFSKIHSLSMQDENLLLAVDLIPPGGGHVLCDVEKKSVTLKDTERISTDTDPLLTAPGRDGSHWLIARTEEELSPGPTKQQVEVHQSSVFGEVVRRLKISPNEPQPITIVASGTEDRIYLLEEDDKRQRVRSLRLVATKNDGTEQPVSDWKVDLEKSITFHKEFSVVDGKPVASPSGSPPPDKVKMKLLANPLLNDDRVTVELAVGFDGDGSFLKTADGLPLCTVSETQELIRALLNPHGVNVIDVFQDDGAVVEQFRVSGVDQMMSFDCGGFELK
jgi:hypothetical protein